MSIRTALPTAVPVAAAKAGFSTATAYRIFGDLWAARTFLVRKDLLPPLTDSSAYEFRRG